MKEMSNQDKVKYVFTHLNMESMFLVDEFYHPETTFIDPVGHHKGVASVRKYYQGLYKNVKSIRFDFTQMIEQGQTVVGVWKMTLVTESLNGGEPIEVFGNSVVTFHENGQAIYHRDYFDMGEFIYERIPVVGFLVRKIKERMKSE